MSGHSSFPGGGDADPREQLSRRLLLKSGLIAGTAGAVAGVGGWRSAPVASPKPRWPAGLRQPGSLPYPDLPMGTDTIPEIRHIIVMMMENHSYDNHLGMLGRPGADGFKLGHNGRPLARSPYADGNIQHAFRMPTTCQLSGMPTQEWEQSHIQFADGRNDGFVISGSGPVAMGYWDADDQPFYYSLARVFPIADRYFCSVMGQTDPNRRYLIAATSTGMVNDTLPELSDYPANGTIFDTLNAAGVRWLDYYTDLPTVDLYPKIYLRNPKKVVPIKQFFADAAAGTLPGYCLVEPNYDTQSEENPANIASGEQFAAQVIDAVISGPGWSKTLLIWNYDEHGGYYDHVPPPAAIAPDSIPPHVPAGESAYNGFAQYGFRVPCAIVSPWARPGYVSHRVMDHASICALVEAKWNLPALTFRDANAHNMLDMLDLSRPAFLTPPTLAKPLVDTNPNALACNTSGPGTIPPPRSVTPPPA